MPWPDPEPMSACISFNLFRFHFFAPGCGAGVGATRAVAILLGLQSVGELFLETGQNAAQRLKLPPKNTEKSRSFVDPIRSMWRVS